MIAYLLFTKRHPFVDVAGLWTATERIIDPEVSPAPVGEMAAALDPRLGRAITRLLQRDPAKRYQTAREVLDDLIGRGPATSTCRACGNENPPDAKFCNSCGGAMAEVELTGTEPDRQLSVSFSLYGAGRTDEAITIARQILAKHEDYGKGWAHLAFMLNQIRRYDEAIEAADKAIQHSPDFASGYRSKGFALSVLRRFDEAAEQFDEALARETRPRDRAQILYNKAYALMLGGRLTEAKEAGGEALEEDPTYYKARSIVYRLENLETSG
jgi:tetratricopeptide (TPR) repeat protein